MGDDRTFKRPALEERNDVTGVLAFRNSWNLPLFNVTVSLCGYCEVNSLLHYMLLPGMPCPRPKAKTTDHGLEPMKPLTRINLPSLKVDVPSRVTIKET